MKPLSKSKNKKKNGLLSIGMAYIGKIFIVGTLIGIITCCIVVSMLAIYFLNMISGDEKINLEDYKVNYTTIIYGKDKKTGEPKEISRLYKNGENRIWEDIENISSYVTLAIIAIEDQRYLAHNGVDWQRTISAFINEIAPIHKGRSGGSTITQQLVKNLTKDDEITYQRKIREMLLATYLEKNYSKQQLIEAYENMVYFGNGAYGIQAAAQAYFGKEARDLSLNEAVAIVATTRNPRALNPVTRSEANKKRSNWIFKKMLDLGFIKEEVYNKAVQEEIALKQQDNIVEKPKVQSYFIDNLIEEVVDDLVAQRGYTRAYAIDQFYSGGFKIYSTVDTDIQDHLEAKFLDNSTFPDANKNDRPQAAMVILDPHGKILGLIGGRGEKKGARVYNRATQSLRQLGSAGKPIAVYAPAIEYDLITYSSIVDDSYFKIENGKPWPVNYYGGYTGKMTIEKAMMRSTNTVAVKICNQLTPTKSFDFLTKKLGITTLIDQERINGKIFSDKNLSSMALGGMTYGVKVLEVAGAYQIFVNGGYYNKPYSYTKILDMKGNIVMEKNITPKMVISPETSMIMNRLLYQVANGPYGTGRAAKFRNLKFELIGKTGSTSQNKDLLFVGASPYYIGAVWYGYDEPREIKYYEYPPPIIWRNVMEPIHRDLPIIGFPTCSNVEILPYCGQTGHIAGPYCPKGGEGYYKKSSKNSAICTMHTSPAFPEGGIENNNFENNANGETPESGNQNIENTTQ